MIARPGGQCPEARYLAAREMRDAPTSTALDAAGVRPNNPAPANAAAGWEAELETLSDEGFFAVWLQRQCDAEWPGPRRLMAGVTTIADGA